MATTTITTGIPDICFSWEIPDIVCETDDEKVSVSLYDSHHGIVYSTVLYSSNGRVIFRDIRPIIENYLKNCSVPFEEFSVFAGNADDEINFACIYCHYSLPVTAQEYLPQSFLSTVNSKLTTLSTSEYIHFYHEAKSYNVRVVGYIQEEDNEVSTLTLQEYTLQYDTNGIATIIVKDLSTLVDKSICAYVVFVDNLSYAFYITERKPSISLLFRNCFGLPETVNLYGSITEKQEIDRSIGMTCRMIEAYDDEPEIKYEFTSALMSENQVRWIKQLLSSHEVLHGERPIIITDSKYEISNADDAEYSISFTFQYKDRRPLLKTTVVDSNIFSQQFNPIFS